MTGSMPPNFVDMRIIIVPALLTALGFTPLESVDLLQAWLAADSMTELKAKLKAQFPPGDLNLSEVVGQDETYAILVARIHEALLVELPARPPGAAQRFTAMATQAWLAWQAGQAQVAADAAAVATKLRF